MTVTGLAFSSPESSTPTYTHLPPVCLYFRISLSKSEGKKKATFKIELQGRGCGSVGTRLWIPSVALRLACCYIPVVPALGKWKQEDQKFQNSVGYNRT